MLIDYIKTWSKVNAFLHVFAQLTTELLLTMNGMEQGTLVIGMRTHARRQSSFNAHSPLPYAKNTHPTTENSDNQHILPHFYSIKLQNPLLFEFNPFKTGLFHKSIIH